MKTFYIKPTQFLQKYIERYWVWESTDSNVQTLPRLIPGTGVEFLLHYGSPFSVYQTPFEVRALPHSHLVCLRNSPVLTRSAKRIGFISVRFRVGAFRHFFNGSMAEIMDNFPAAKDIWGKEGLELEERIIQAADVYERVKILDACLTAFFSRYQRDDSELDHAAKKIYYGYRDFDLQRVSESCNVGIRQLERRFKSALGINPKALHRNARFESTLKYLLLNHKSQYLDCIMDNGYYDQSHFIKDFHHFTGEAPSSFLNKQNFMSHFYNKKLSQ